MSGVRRPGGAPAATAAPSPDATITGPEPARRGTSVQSVSRERRRRQRVVRGTLGVFLFLILWELTYQLEILNPLYFSEPVAIMRNLFELIFVEGTLLPDIEATVAEFGLGFLIGTFAGTTLGVLIGWFRWLDDMTDPLVAAIYATPYVAFLPLIVIIVGIDLWSKAIIVIWAVFFPVLINGVAGVKNTPPEFLRAARSFSVGRVRMFTTVVLPSALPYLLAGLRQAVGRGLVGVIVAEFFLANEGLGFFIREAAATFRPEDAFAGIFLISIAGIALVRIVGRFERKVGSTWGTSQNV